MCTFLLGYIILFTQCQIAFSKWLLTFLHFKMTAEKSIRHMGCMSLWYHHRAGKAFRMGTDAHLATVALALKSKYIDIKILH